MAAIDVHDSLGKGKILLLTVFRAWGHKELLLRTGQMLSRTGASDGINCTWLSLVVDNTKFCLWFMGKQENCTFVESSLSLSGWRGLESNNSFIKSSLFSGRGKGVGGLEVGNEQLFMNTTPVNQHVCFILAMTCVW